MLALLILSVLMFLGCYVAGYVPLAFNYSPTNMRLVTIFGAGLLVGAALAIIIPEGVVTIYGMQEQRIWQKDSQEVVNFGERHLNHIEPRKVEHAAPDAERIPPPPVVDKTISAPSTSSNHGLIGLALTMGFVLMFLVDHLGTSVPNSEGVTPLSASSTATLAAAEHSARTTTLGLVVHSLADGLAIGAAFGLTLDLTLILFIAIMLHKAPAAFGFVSFLVHEGLPRNRVKVYLIAFALASPVGALLTYLTIFATDYLTAQPLTSTGVATSSASATGFALLLSAGTFLYVATAHILPHLKAEKLSSSSSLNGGMHHRHQGEATFKPTESIAFVLGSCVPVLISFGHSH